MTFGRSFLTEWPLDPAVTYLNHGTVGVTPNRVLAAQREIRDAIERQPSRFLLRELAASGLDRPPAETPRMRAAAQVVGAFLGARGDDLVFVDNTTTGCGAVLRSLPLEAGDEILMSDLAYGGIVRSATFAARLRGATVRIVEVPWPFHPDRIVEAFEQGVTSRTRIAVVDHVAAHAALVLPLAEIARRLKSKGVAVLADGAHAPGAIPVDISSYDVDWYVANLHKWAWVPRSSGILWARPERQGDVHPLVTSWGLDKGFTSEFDMPGTRDPSAHLAAPAAIALFHEWGLESIRQYNHDLAWRGAQYLADRWETGFEIAESMIGTMAAVAVPPVHGSTVDDAQALRDRLLFDKNIEVQVHAWRGRIFARISAQVYNDDGDIERLADAVLTR